MNKLTQLCFLLLCICLPAATLHADEKKERDDSKYLAGAVPEVDGKVVFTKEFSIPGMSQEEIFKRMKNWMEARLKKNGNNSRVVYSNLDEGQIVGTGEEWIVFSSSALSLDRTVIIYQLSVVCAPEKCTMEVEKIRFVYREGKEKYTAEEWITDKYALNKAKTKLVRGLAKWRRNTVDFADNLALEAADALSASTAQKAAEQPKEIKEEKTVVNSGPIVIAPKTPVTAVMTPESNVQVKVVPATPLTPSTPVAAGTMPGYKEVAPDQLPADAIRMGAGKLVLVIGSDAFNMTMMTANAGGSLGKTSGKPVIFSFLSPDQPYEQMEKAETYTVRFYPANQTEPSVVLECKKMPSQAPMEGQPRMYVGEILKAFVK